jgi:hypothetical protein
MMTGQSLITTMAARYHMDQQQFAMHDELVGPDHG